MDIKILEHFQTIRDDTETTQAQYDDSEMLKIYNRAREKIEARFKSLNKKYFYTEWVTDLVENQIEYLIPVQTDQFPAKIRRYIRGYNLIPAQTDQFPACTEVISVAIKNNEKWEILPYIDTMTPNNIEELRENGYGYAVMDRSIFVFPKTQKEVLGGLKIYGIYKLRPLNENSTEKDIGFALQDYDLIIQQAKILIYEQKKLWNERNIAIQDLENMWNIYKSNFYRDKGPYFQKIPYFNNFL